MNPAMVSASRAVASASYSGSGPELADATARLTRLALAYGRDGLAVRRHSYGEIERGIADISAAITAETAICKAARYAADANHL